MAAAMTINSCRRAVVLGTGASPLRRAIIAAVSPFLLGQVTHVDDSCRFERPDKCLDPRHDGQKTDPPHGIDRVCLG